MCVACGVERTCLLSCNDYNEIRLLKFNTPNDDDELCGLAQNKTKMEIIIIIMHEK